MSNKMTAHEWEIACGDLKAENDQLKLNWKKCQHKLKEKIEQKEAIHQQLLDKTSNEEVLRKAIEEAYNILCLVETGQEHHEYMEITNDDFQALKKALAGKEDGRNLGSPKEPKKPESTDRKEGE